jgi:2-iminobutanoate/2-iminopropanoate deaminase
VDAFLSPEVAAPSGAYSHAVVSNGLVFLAGQAPLRPDGSVVEGDLGAQLEQVVRNLDAAARSAGADLRRAVRIGAYLSPRADLAEYNRLYAQLFDFITPPVRTTTRSEFTSFDVELDAILELAA